jgi:ketosteroid isomerase-like protein
LFALVSCAGTRPFTKEAEDQARAEIAALVHEQYAALERGDADSWAAPLSEDAFVFGYEPKEMLHGRDQARAELARQLAEDAKTGKRRAYRSLGLAIGLSPDGQVGWASDEIDFAQAQGASEHRSRLRMTALLGRRSGRWQIEAAHYSLGLPDTDALFLAMQGDLPFPVEVTGKIARNADTIVQIFRDQLGDPLQGLTELSDELLFVGSAPDLRFEGAAYKAYIRPVLEQLGEHRPDATLLEPVSARLVSGESAGFIAANVVFTYKMAMREVSLPMRVLAVFVRGPGGWKVVCEHQSLGLYETTLLKAAAPPSDD